jgi:hypothetical protein
MRTCAPMIANISVLATLNETALTMCIGKENLEGDFGPTKDAAAGESPAATWL